MEFGVSTLLFFDDTGIEKHFDELASHGVSCIEIRNTVNHLPRQGTRGLPAMRAELRASGLRLHSLHLPAHVLNALHVAAEAPRRAAVREAAELARALVQLDGRVLICHPGGLLEGAPRSEAFCSAQDSVAELAAVCKELDVRLALENTLPTAPRLGTEIEEVLRFVEPFDPATVGFCLDTSHANLSSSNPVAALRLMRERLITLHLSDNDGKKDLHALPFSGTVDWPAFMTELGRIDYRGPLMFEVRGGGPLPAVLDELRNAFGRLARLTAS